MFLKQGSVISTLLSREDVELNKMRTYFHVGCQVVALCLSAYEIGESFPLVYSVLLDATMII